jgi:hypothetical protein|tara:strand:+ start:418 stop:585 length:168 start_codon:yes stop_codon:yes gene_type:complete
MSRSIVDAIESGDNIKAKAQFSDAMISKVGGSLESNRQELANSFVNGKVNDAKET